MAVIGAIIAAVAPYAAVASAVAGVAVGATSAAAAAEAQEQGARDAQRLAEMNAQASERESSQARENMAAQQEQEQAKNKALASSSGVDDSFTGSFGLVMGAQKNQDQDQLAWLRESGQNQAEIIRAGGQSAYNVGMAQADASKAQIGSNIVGGISDVYGISNNAGWLS